MNNYSTRVTQSVRRGDSSSPATHHAPRTTLSSPATRHAPPATLLPPATRSGFLLIDLLMGMLITAMICGMMGSVILAATSAWDHATGVEDATQQARISMDRIKYMLSQAGVYHVTGQPVMDGIAVVNRTVASVPYPEVLVIWSGGQNGGMAAVGLQARLPLVSELVLYAPQTDDPSRLVEITSPTDMSSIDFTSPSFTTTILAIVDSSQSKNVLLSDRVHLSSLPSGGATTAGNIRFEVFKSPSGTSLTGVNAGTTEWSNLVWSQGVVTSGSGLRQTTVRMEFQLNLRPNSPTGSLTTTAAFPFIGSASYRYIYNP